MNGFYFLLPFLLVILIASHIDVSAVKSDEKIIKHEMNDNSKRIKQTFNLTDVYNGAQITNTIASFSLDSFLGESCVMVLNESHLNKDVISDVFSCGLQNNIQLNKIGVDALSSKLRDARFNIEVKTVENNIIPITSNSIHLDISYNEPVYYAEIENNVVKRVILADYDFIKTQKGQWVETKQGDAVLNFASAGYQWDGSNFIPPKPFDSWILKNGKWEAPISHPVGDGYSWNESSKTWDGIK